MSDVMRMEFRPWDISVSLIEPAYAPVDFKVHVCERVTHFSLDCSYVATSIASKQLGENSPLKHVDQEKLKLYQSWADKAFALRAANEKKASPPSVTTEAIVDAITSPQPKTRYVAHKPASCSHILFDITCRRYVVANVGGVPAWIYTWVAWFLPDNIQDFVTTR